MKKLLLPLTILSVTNIYADHNESSTFLDDLIENTEKYRMSIHNVIVNTSSNVDNFFFEDKLEHKDYNSSFGLLELSLSHNQHEDVQFDQKFKVKLKLPRLKDNFRLEIESDEERESKDFVENKNSSSKNDNVNLGVAFYKKFKHDINFKSKVGLKIKSTFDPFIKLTADKTYDYNNYYYTLGQILKESRTKKLESTTYFNIDKPLDEIYSVHNNYQYYWHSEEKADSEFYISLYLDQKLTNKSYLRYLINSNINNIDSVMKVKRYSAQVKYRHFLKKWLYIDTIPENYYSEELNFKPRYAIRFNLGMYFNKDSY